TATATALGARRTGAVRIAIEPRETETPLEFPSLAWDPDFRADVYKAEFYATRSWKDRRDDLVTLFRDDLVTRLKEDNVRAELEQLGGVRMRERSEHLGEIIGEQQGIVMISYWFNL